MDALFEPLNRLGQEYGEIEGNGIGLSISKSLAEQMDGTIIAECEPDKGCCFRVKLPAGNGNTVNNSMLDSEPNISPVDSPSKNKQILYIEDNYSNLKMVEKILKQRRPQVTFLSAMHPKEGIELAKTHRPDLILMDINLPEINGIEAYSELKNFKETCDIPVIAISANAFEKDIRATLDSGFKDYLTKPVNFDNLISIIDTIK
jgi:CheY-like chemotaxis protein